MKDNKALKVTCIVVIVLLLVATLALTMLKNYLMLPDGKVRELIAAERLVCHPQTFLDYAAESAYQLDSAGQQQFLQQGTVCTPPAHRSTRPIRRLQTSCWCGRPRRWTQGM